MADQSGANPGQAADGAGQPSLAVSVQYVKDMSFETPGAPHSLGDLNPPPEIGVEINVETNMLQEGIHEVTLNVRARATRGDTTFFIVELSYAGVFILQNIPQEHVQPLVTIEGPRILFPFARAIVANATRDGGFPPLLINPIDFGRLYQQNAQAQPGAHVN